MTEKKKRFILNEDIYREYLEEQINEDLILAVLSGEKKDKSSVKSERFVRSS